MQRDFSEGRTTRRLGRCSFRRLRNLDSGGVTTLLHKRRSTFHDPSRGGPAPGSCAYLALTARRHAAWERQPTGHPCGRVQVSNLYSPVLTCNTSGLADVPVYIIGEGRGRRHVEEVLPVSEALVHCGTAVVVRQRASVDRLSRLHIVERPGIVPPLHTSNPSVPHGVDQHNLDGRDRGCTQREASCEHRSQITEKKSKAEFRLAGGGGEGSKGATGRAQSHGEVSVSSPSGARERAAKNACRPEPAKERLDANREARPSSQRLPFGMRMSVRTVSKGPRHNLGPAILTQRGESDSLLLRRVSEVESCGESDWGISSCAWAYLCTANLREVGQTYCMQPEFGPDAPACSSAGTYHDVPESDISDPSGVGRVSWE